MKELGSWKIRNKDGLFSTGGADPKFHKVGNTWNTLCAVKQHIAAELSWHKAPNKIEFYKDCDIVCFELKEKEVLPIKVVYEGKL